MKKRIITIVLTAMLLVPTFSSNVYAAEKYFAVNRTENGYEAFQEDESQNIEKDDVYICSNGKYKFVIQTDAGYIGQNQGKEVFNNLDELLEKILPTKKGEEITFNLFNNKDITPKEYQYMLSNAKILVFDTNNEKVDSFSLLKYKDYTQFTDSSLMTVKLNKYTGNDGVNTGVDLTVSWKLKDETPEQLIITNDDVGFVENYDISKYKDKDSVDMNLLMRYNGTYTVTLETAKSEYSQQIKFDKLEDDVRVDDNKEKTPDKEKGVKRDKSDVKIEVSGLPKEKLTDGKSFILEIGTNVKTNIEMNGRTDSDYKKAHKFNITENGTYVINAYSEAGKSAKKVVKVNCFKPVKVNNKNSFGRSDFWTGTPDTINNAGEENKLVQTGMYNIGIVVAAGIFLVLGIGLVVLVMIKGKKKTTPKTVKGITTEEIKDTTDKTDEK